MPHSPAVACACINLLTEKLCVPDLARIVCSYISKRSDKDIVFAHFDTCGSIYFSKNDGLVCGRAKYVIFIWILHHTGVDSRLIYERQTGGTFINGESDIDLFDTSDSYNPTQIPDFMKSANTLYPEYAWVDALLCEDINDYIKSILEPRDYRHVCN